MIKSLHKHIAVLAFVSFSSGSYAQTSQLSIPKHLERSDLVHRVSQTQKVESTNVCTVHIERLRQDATTEWTGACVDGLANGPGKYTEWLGDQAYRAITFDEDRGAILKSGRPVASIPLGSLDVRINECPKTSNYRSADTVVSEKLDLAIPEVFWAVIEESEKRVLRACPITRAGKPVLTNVVIQVKQRDALAGRVRSYPENSAFPDHGRRVWGEWDNYLGARRINSERAIIANIERNRVALAQEAARMRQRELASMAVAKSQALAAKHRAIGWIPMQQVAANVFSHEGRTYLVRTRFHQMISRDTAQFGDGIFQPALLLVGVPSTSFTDRKDVVVVGKIAPPKGNGDTRVLRMQYLGHEFCTAQNCTDFGDIPASR